MADLIPELVVDIDPPIEWNNGKYDTLALREPKAMEVQKALAVLGNASTPDSVTKYQIALVGAVTGLPRQVVEQLPIRKLNEAANFLQQFVNAGPETGETN